MSDTSQGPGWWQASDGKWYPPESAPGGGGGGAAGGASYAAGGGFSIGEAFSYGWNKFVQYIGQIIVIVLVIFAIQVVFSILSQVLTRSGGIGAIMLGSAIWVIGMIVGFVLQAGLIRAGLAVTRGESPEVGMLFQTTNLGPFIIASILVGLLFFVGILACCIGVVVVAIFTLFYGYYIIDKSAQPVDSISSSFKLVKDNFGVVLGFAILAFLLNLVTCGLAVGVTQIATAYAYKKLTGQPVAA
jgi:uncharacterized membrane protein